MHGVAPHMCCQEACPLLGGGAGGRSPGFLFVRAQHRALLHDARTHGHTCTIPGGGRAVSQPASARFFLCRSPCLLDMPTKP